MNRQAVLHSVPEGEERLLLAKAFDQAMIAYKRKQPAFTDFMDCAKCSRFRERLQGIPGLQIVLFGGTEACERQQMGFFPLETVSLEAVSWEREFPIRIVKIRRKSKKFGQADLSHRDYLGSLLGLGIDRGKIGDILVEDTSAVCFVAEEMVSYICMTLEQVSKTAVIAEVCAEADALPKRQTESKRVTVPSLRLDAVMGEVFPLSRGKVQALIGAEKAAVNWNTVTSVSHLLREGDMVSLRGFGRFRILAVGGKTKKDRIGLEIERYI